MNETAETFEDAADHRWAFGTGFADPLEGVDTRVPADVDSAALTSYCLMLGDDALIYSQRLQQWVARMPELEEETALANIALDLIGQARLLYTRAGHVEGRGRDEDQFAFFRAEREFRNVRFVEREDRDFAELVARMLVFATWRLAVLDRLRGCADPVLRAIADKSAKELAYHRDYAAQWVVRLGDGTPLSRARMQAGLDAIWPLVDELFRPDPPDTVRAGVAVDPVAIRAEVDVVIETVLATATLERPTVESVAPIGGTGRDGAHTEAFGYILAEMQSVARAYPRGVW